MQCVEYDTFMIMLIADRIGITRNNKNGKSMLKWELVSKLWGGIINKTEI